MARQIISTPNAPAAIGPYSQAVKAGNLVYLSGQIGLDPATMEMVDGVEAQARQVFANLKAVCEAAGGSLGETRAVPGQTSGSRRWLWPVLVVAAAFAGWWALRPSRRPRQHPHRVRPRSSSPRP